jgi:hypothetical protein
MEEQSPQGMDNHYMNAHYDAKSGRVVFASTKDAKVSSSYDAVSWASRTYFQKPVFKPEMARDESD